MWYFNNKAYLKLTKTDNKAVLIDSESITTFEEIDENKVMIYTNNGSFTVYSTIEDIEKLLGLSPKQ